MFENGKGVAQDYAKAAEWYLLSAEQGYMYAQNNIGVLYETGKGVAQDYAKAAKWYLLAAEQGNAWAQNNIGWYYHNGFGVPRDYEKAAEWYRKAVAQGNPKAQVNLKNIKLLLKTGAVTKRSRGLRKFINFVVVAIVLFNVVKYAGPFLLSKVAPFLPPSVSSIVYSWMPSLKPDSKAAGRP
jgi:hypothetical protein